MFPSSQQTPGSGSQGGAPSNTPPNNAQSMPLMTASVPSSGVLSRLPASYSSHPFQYIRECLTPGSPNYRFRFMFYNRVPAGVQANPVRPPYVSDAMWRQMIEDNPDPTRYVPVLSNGFTDLLARRDFQDDCQRAHVARIKEVNARLSTLLSKQDLDVAAAMQSAQRQQLRLMRRLLEVLRRIHAIATTSASQPLLQREQDIIARLQSLAARLGMPPLSEIPTLAQRCASISLSDGFSHENENLDSNEADALMTALVKQQHAISVLVDVVARDTRDLDIIQHGYA